MAQVLLVDDETKILDVFSRFLKADGHIVHTATSATEAFSVIQKAKIEVIVADIYLGGLDGLEFLSFIRKASKKIEVIIITGRPCEESKQKAMSDNAFAYLTKPVRGATLCEVVNKAAQKIKDNK